MEWTTLGNNASIAGMKVPYLYVLGFENELDSGRSYNPYFTPVEEARFLELSKDP